MKAFGFWHRLFFGDRPPAQRKPIAALERIGGWLSGIVFATLMCCDFRGEAATPTSTPATSVESTATASPRESVAASPSISPTQNPTKNNPETLPAQSTTPVPAASTSPVADPFEEGLKQLLQASGTAFRDLRGNLKKTEKGSGAQPLFRVRKIYEGAFLFDGAVSAEIEEVYFHAGQQPAYNYHLYFQGLSPRESIERYDNLRLNLNHVLQSFDHTFGYRYDAWAGQDALKTAVLLSVQDASGSPELQIHVAFPSPQW
jgi:hypothetical protein